MLLSVATRRWRRRWTPQQAESYFWTRGRTPQNVPEQDDIADGRADRRLLHGRDRFDDIHVGHSLRRTTTSRRSRSNFDRKVPDEVQQELFQSVARELLQRAGRACDPAQPGGPGGSELERGLKSARW